MTVRYEHLATSADEGTALGDDTQTERYAYNVLARCLVKISPGDEINDYAIVLPFDVEKCPFLGCNFVIANAKSNLWRHVFRDHFSSEHGACGLTICQLTLRREELLNDFPERPEYLPQRLIENWVKFLNSTPRSLFACVTRWAETPDRLAMWQWVVKKWDDIKRQRLFQANEEYKRLTKLRIELLRHCLPWFVGVRRSSALQGHSGHVDDTLIQDFQKFLQEHRLENRLLLRPDEILLSWAGWTSLCYVTVVYSMFSLGLEYRPMKFTYVPTDHMSNLREKVEERTAQERSDLLLPRWRHPVSKLAGALGYIYRDDDRKLEGKFLDWSEINLAAWMDFLENYGNYANAALYFENTCQFLDSEGIDLLPSKPGTATFRDSSHTSQWEASDPSAPEFAFYSEVSNEFSKKPKGRIGRPPGATTLKRGMVAASGNPSPQVVRATARGGGGG